MGHSQAEKAKSHERILGIAARQIREQGLQSVSVAELMQQAGLTHGGFYSHFASRDALIAEALERALDDSEAALGKATAGNRTLKTVVKNYLSRAHRDAPGVGCAIGALSGELRHAGPETRAILTRHLEQSFKRMVALLGNDEAARARALTAMSTMVGALTLARAVDDPALSDEILQATRRALIAQAGANDE